MDIGIFFLIVFLSGMAVALYLEHVLIPQIIRKFKVWLNKWKEKK